MTTARSAVKRVNDLGQAVREAQEDMTGGNYRLVSEEEWENLNEALEHAEQMRRMESDCATHWQRRAEAAEAKANIPAPEPWTYTFDCPADDTEEEIRERRGEIAYTHTPTECEYDRTVRAARAGCREAMNEAPPQRPHDSLVWAILRAGVYDAKSANALLEEWRKRWPED